MIKYFKKKNEETKIFRETVLKANDGLRKQIADVALEVIQKTNKITEIEQQYMILENKLDKKLNDFYKEFTDRYFENLSAFLRWNKEISLVSYMTGGKELNLTKLKQEMMRPMTEANWAKTNAEETEKINIALASKGEKIRLAQTKYKEEKLSIERVEGDTTLVDAKLEILNILME